MNLQQLRFAVSVASTRSFTASASACAVTQPTLSNAIAHLEAELGEKLFVRTTRKVALTAFGRHIMPDIERILAAQRDLLRSSKSFLAPEKRLIRIGTSPLLDGRFLNLLLEAFRAQQPESEIILREMNMADLSRMLDNEELDFIFGIEEPPKDGRETAFLYREPLLFIPNGSRSAMHPGAVTLDEIANETFVMVPDACGLARKIRDLFRIHRKAIAEYPGEALNYLVLEQWAALGIGAAILPRSKISEGARLTHQLEDRRRQPIDVVFQASWNRSTVKLPQLSQFVLFLRQILPTVLAGLAPVGAP